MERLLVVLALVISSQARPLVAQEAPGVVTATPSLGFGAVLDRGHPESGGMSAMVQIEMGRKRIGGGVFASVRGMGVGCADSCDLSGQAFGAEIAVLFGRLRAGAGLGLIRRFKGWHSQPHGALSLALGAFRMQLRVEVSGGSNAVHVPLLVGRRIRIR